MALRHTHLCSLAAHYAAVADRSMQQTLASLGVDSLVIADYVAKAELLAMQYGLVVQTIQNSAHIDVDSLD